MMRIYLPQRVASSELAHPTDAADFETLNVTINGEPRVKTWRPIPFEVIARDEGQTLQSSDAPWLGSHALVLREEAASRLGSVLSGHAEVLPLQCADGIVVVNPLHVLDILDEEKSAIDRFASGRIMRVREYQFHLTGSLPPLFKIPNLRVSPTFVSESFVNAWRQHALAGLEFDLIWAG